MYIISITTSHRRLKYNMQEIDTAKEAIKSAMDTIEKIFTEDEKGRFIISCIKGQGKDA